MASIEALTQALRGYTGLPEGLFFEDVQRNGQLVMDYGTIYSLTLSNGDHFHAIDVPKDLDPEDLLEAIPELVEGMQECLSRAVHQRRT